MELTKEEWIMIVNALDCGALNYGLDSAALAAKIMQYINSIK